MCLPMRAHWRHLANRPATELEHPSAHSTPQPKQQIDRFSRFCAAHGRKCLYFTMGAPIHQNCPFPWGSGPSSNTWCEPTTKTAPQLVQPCLHRRPQSVPLPYNGSPVSSSKLPLRMGIWTPYNAWFLRATRVLNPNGNSIASAVSVRFTSVTDWQSHWVTDRPRGPRYSVGNHSI